VAEFHIHHVGYVSNIETVEAETVDEAIEASQVGAVSLCHQCTDEWDAGGDPDIYEVTDADGKIVWSQPQTEVDRETVLKLLRHHGVTSGRSYTRQELSRYRDELADAVLALLNGKSDG
jgi:hypothetical protein